MINITKEYFLLFLERLLKTGKKEYLSLILGKPKNISNLEDFLDEIESKHKHGYTIFGCGIVDSTTISLDPEEDDISEIMDTFIPIRTDEEFENFKRQVLEEIDNYEITKAEEEQIFTDDLRNKISEIVSDTESQEIILKVLKNSRKLKGEELYHKVDKVYKLVDKRQTVVDLFKLIDKNLKGYIVKDRKFEVKYEEEEEENE